MKYSLKTITKIEELIKNEMGKIDEEGCEVLCKKHFLLPILRELKRSNN